MSAEIVKLYENVGIKGEWRDYRVKNGKVYNGKNPKNRNIRLCHPRFTAEKQIELIKWLAIKGDFDSSIDIAKNAYDYWTIYFQGTRWTAEGFEETLAGLINNFWQDLTEEEKQEIKRILT